MPGPKNITLNLPPEETTVHPRNRVNWLNWRNWLALVIAAILVYTAFKLSFLEQSWREKVFDAFKTI